MSGRITKRIILSSIPLKADCAGVSALSGVLEVEALKLGFSARNGTGQKFAEERPMKLLFLFKY